MSKQSARVAQALTFGAVPRAQLLPPEVGMRKKERGRRRGLIALVSLVLLATVGGVVGSYWLAGQAEQRLAAERLVTQDLLNQQLDFGEVLGIQARLNSVDEQRALLESVEVRWQQEISPYLSIVAESGIVDSLTLTNNDPFTPPLVLSDPLRSPRSAKVIISVLSPGLPDVASWLRAFESIDSYADSSIDTVIIDEEASYLTTITLNLNDGALLVPPAAEEETE